MFTQGGTATDCQGRKIKVFVKARWVSDAYDSYWSNLLLSSLYCCGSLHLLPITIDQLITSVGSKISHGSTFMDIFVKCWYFKFQPPLPTKRAKRIQLVHFHCCDILKTPCPTATGSLSGWGFPFYIALFLEWSVLGWSFRHSNMKLTTSWDKYDCCRENTGAGFSWVVLATMATGVWSREGRGCTNIALCSGRMRWLPAKTLGWHLDLVVRDKVTLTTWLADNMVLVIP